MGIKNWTTSKCDACGLKVDDDGALREPPPCWGAVTLSIRNTVTVGYDLLQRRDKMLCPKCVGKVLDILMEGKD